MGVVVVVPKASEEVTRKGLIEAMLVHGMIIQGRARSGHYGAAAVGKPKEQDIERCRELGRMVATLVLKLKT